MSSTVFVNGVTLTDADWFNDVNRLQYTILGDPANIAAVKIAVNPTLATEQASTSGTSIDFSGIPSGVKRITIMFVGVSTNGTSNLLIQIGDSGGIETSGYVSTGLVLLDSTAVAGTTSAAGFLIKIGAATVMANGQFVLNLENAAAFTWTGNGALMDSATGAQFPTTGRKSTSAELDRVRITTVNGTDAFDAGAINISYE